MIIPHVAGVVGRHDGVVGVGLKLAMHDLVSVWRVLAAEVSVGVDVEGAAKHAPVELQSLAGVAVEVEVRIQPRRHRLLLPPRDRRDSRAPPPGPADRINPLRGRPTAAEPLAETGCPRDASVGAVPGRSLSPKRFARRRATGQPPPQTSIEPNAPNRFSARTNRRACPAMPRTDPCSKQRRTSRYARAKSRSA